MMLRNFSYVIDDQLAGCAHPEACGDCDEALEELKRHGIGALVSLDEDGVPLYLIADHDQHHLHLPVTDLEPPTFEQAQQFLDFVERERQAGRKVAVHCRAGLGRTGTMLACYLVGQGMSALEAINHVRMRRPGSIETFEQERFVHAFAEFHASQAGEPAVAARPRKRARRKRKS
jgi:atypical dual specificity phosphatase